MLKVNGEIPSGVFGSLVLLWLLGNQWLWRVKIEARKILDQISQFSTTKPISIWRASPCLLKSCFSSSLCVHVGWTLSSKRSVLSAAEGRGYAERCWALPSSGPAKHSSMCSHSSWSTGLQSSPSRTSSHWTLNISMATEPTKSQRLLSSQWDLSQAKHIWLGSSCIRVISL